MIVITFTITMTITINITITIMSHHEPDRPARSSCHRSCALEVRRSTAVCAFAGVNFPTKATALRGATVLCHTTTCSTFTYALHTIGYV